MTKHIRGDPSKCVTGASSIRADSPGLSEGGFLLRKQNPDLSSLPLLSQKKKTKQEIRGVREGGENRQVWRA